MCISKYHLRTVQQHAAYFRDKDPDTAITEYLIRKIVYSGEIPSVQSGIKRLSTREDLEAYLFEGKRWPNV